MNKLKHLEMIQMTISRMASNSFLLKGWSITLTVGSFVLISYTSNVIPLTAVVVPIIFFWILDSYYLLQERRYRCLYDEVRLKDESEIDFSMLPQDTQNKKGLSLVNCIFSTIEALFYVPVIILAIALFSSICR